MAGKNTEGAKVQAPETKTAGKNTEGAKVYRFTSQDPFLSCFALGIQFIDGKASTSNLEVAKALVKIKGVELIEE